MSTHKHFGIASKIGPKTILYCQSVKKNNWSINSKEGQVPTHTFKKIRFLSCAYVVSPGPTSRNSFFHSFILSFFHSFRIQFSRLYSVQSVVRALTTRELYSLRSTCVHTLNTNSAHNTLRNKIGMSVGIAVVGI